MAAISVVIPVYNTEKYLSRCLDSILGQTFRDLEILCIDDGSTDRTPEILRRYAELDDRIRIITLPENHGVPYARNLAIDEARGEYLYYMDSDDWLDLDYLEEMYRHAVTSGQDVVINSNWYFEYGVIKKSSGALRPEFNVKEPTYFPTVLIQSSFYPVVWARLYRLGYLRENNIRSPQVKGGVDDNFFTSLAEILQPRSYVFSGPFYHYFQRVGSLSRQKDPALNYSQVFSAFLHELKGRGIAPGAAKRFYVFLHLVIEDKNAFDSIRSFFSEAEPDVFESPQLYMYNDFRSMEMVLDCPDYNTFRSRYPSGFNVMSDVSWETGRMAGIMGRIPSSKLKLIPARDLLSPLRFDLFSFLFYIKNKEVMPGFSKRVFREVGRSYVNKRTKRRGNFGKQAFDNNVAGFDKLLARIAGNSSEDYRIPVGKWPVPLDGSHIVAAASFYDRDVSVFNLASADKGNNDYTICLGQGMSRLVADLTAREGVEWIKTPIIICFWSCGKSDNRSSGDVLYSRDFLLGPVSYPKLKALITPGQADRKGWSRVRFVFCQGLEQVIEGDDFQVIEDPSEVKRVADLLLTWKGRREWYRGGGLLCRLAESLERTYDFFRAESRWGMLWLRRFFICFAKRVLRILNIILY